MKKLKYIFLFLSFVVSILASCEKKNNPSAAMAAIEPPSSSDPSEIARVIDQDIKNRLKGRDMGSGMPSLELVESRGSSYTYTGKVPFYSGASSFEREISATYSGNSVVYSYTNDGSGEKITISWSGNVKEEVISPIQNKVLKILSPGEILPIINRDIVKRGLQQVGNLKYIPKESTNDFFVYKEYGYGAGGDFEYFTAYYDGNVISYLYEHKPELTYTIELEPDESRYIIPPKGATIITLQYPGYIASVPQHFLHFTLSNSEISYLKKVSEMDNLGSNLFVHYDTHQGLKGILKIVTDPSEISESDSILANFLYGYAASMQGEMISALLDGFNIDALPEQLYPITDRRSEERLLTDIETSKFFYILLIATTMEYIELASLDDQTKSRRIQRLNNNLSSGNRSLFNKIFGSDLENIAIQGFTE